MCVLIVLKINLAEFLINVLASSQLSCYELSMINVLFWLQ